LSDPSGALSPNTFKKEGYALTIVDGQKDQAQRQALALTRSHNCGIITLHDQSRGKYDTPYYCLGVNPKCSEQLHVPFALVRLVGFVDESLQDVSGPLSAGEETGLP